METALPQQHPSIPLTQPDSLSVRVPSSLSLKQTTHTALRPSTDKQDRVREKKKKKKEKREREKTRRVQSECPVWRAKKRHAKGKSSSTKAQEEGPVISRSLSFLPGARLTLAEQREKERKREKREREREQGESRSPSSLRPYFGHGVVVVETCEDTYQTTPKAP